jgi:hypothetical protein
VGAVTLNRLLADANGGWSAYTPNTSILVAPDSSTGSVWRDATVWLGAIVVWTGLALWLYR